MSIKFMGLFNFNKKRDTIDFTKIPNKKIVEDKNTNLPINSKGYVDLSKSETPKTNSENSPDLFNFFSETSNNPTTQENQISPLSQNNETEELKKLLKRTTTGIETNSNEIYKLMQRLELLEKKIERFENRGF